MPIARFCNLCRRHCFLSRKDAHRSGLTDGAMESHPMFLSLNGVTLEPEKSIEVSHPDQPNRSARKRGAALWHREAHCYRRCNHVGCGSLSKPKQAFQLISRCFQHDLIAFSRVVRTYQLSLFVPATGDVVVIGSRATCCGEP